MYIFVTNNFTSWFAVGLIVMGKINYIKNCFLRTDERSLHPFGNVIDGIELESSNSEIFIRWRLHFEVELQAIIFLSDHPLLYVDFNSSFGILICFHLYKFSVAVLVLFFSIFSIYLNDWITRTPTRNAKFLQILFIVFNNLME